MNKSTVNIILGVTLAGILLYFGETNTLLTLIAIGALGYLVFSNGLVQVAG